MKALLTACAMTLGLMGSGLPAAPAAAFPLGGAAVTTDEATVPVRWVCDRYRHCVWRGPRGRHMYYGPARWRHCEYRWRHGRHGPYRERLCW